MRGGVKCKNRFKTMLKKFKILIIEAVKLCFVQKVKEEFKIEFFLCETFFTFLYKITLITLVQGVPVNVGFD